MRFKVGKWTLDERQFCLLHGDRRVELTPTACRLLQLFISQSDKVVSITTIKEQVWNTEFTTDNLVYQTIRNLRLALEDTDEQAYIKTIPRFGYQLVAPIKQLPGTPDIPLGSRNSSLRFMATLFVAILAVLCAYLVWSYLSRSPADSNQQLIKIFHFDTGTKENGVHSDRIVQQIAKTLQVKDVVSISAVNLFAQLNQHGNGAKLVLRSIPEKNQMLTLVFVGSPARLSYIDLRSVSEFKESKTLSELASQLQQPVLSRGNSGIATLATSSQVLRALVSLSNSAKLAQARTSLQAEIDTQSLNEHQKRAKKAFVDNLLAFYRQEPLSDEHLLPGINFLLSRYHQSNYALLTASLYLAERGAPQIAFELIENLEQDLFITFIQGLMHLELDEAQRALKHFERVFNLAPEFEDNTFFYFMELIESGRNNELPTHRQMLLSSQYQSTASHYILLNYYIMQGQFEDAFSLLPDMKAALSCNDDLAGSLALLNTALGNIAQSEQWLLILSKINHRDWRIPWVVFSNYAFKHQLPAYPRWYSSYRTEVLGNDSLYEPLFLNVLAHFAAGDINSAQQNFALMQAASSAFSKNDTLDIASAVTHAQLEFENTQERIEFLTQFETVAQTLTEDETALPSLISALYFTLYNDFSRAEQALINSCTRSPAMCTSWHFLPSLKPIANTTKLKQAGLQAHSQLEFARQPLTALNKQLLPLCNKP
ncbi:winged helix-turn-helix domain-containing protein [Pseudoalteromonas rubra]|uniref:OmpR/PhoB-type domain-containing protein n=1 Tax=Pseudoalteromonas rubra TaxID=43658 RepID=A0A0F4QPP9_9GAMM|nr:winged helix-turn-helix domain-containing protein [Pseudoalteromonas rubra]KJZ09663.1 hypothetical protein TW77_09210 [Pseudoalteromonas rubra]